MNLFIEIKAAEGGDDSKDLVKIQSNIYAKLASRNYL
jgi:hypothetical protein